MSRLSYEPEKERYRREHARERGPPQHTCHYYSYELHNSIYGGRPKETAWRNYVDHQDNFVMGRPGSNLSKQKNIDHDFAETLQGYKPRGDVEYVQRNGIPYREYEARFGQQIASLKASGGLGNQVIRDGMYRIADAYGFDKRQFNGW